MEEAWDKYKTQGVKDKFKTLHKYVLTLKFRVYTGAMH